MVTTDITTVADVCISLEMIEDYYYVMVSAKLAYGGYDYTIFSAKTALAWLWLARKCI